nr:DUF2500 domain-containing protein [Kineosporia babensis]
MNGLLSFVLFGGVALTFVTVFGFIGFSLIKSLRTWNANNNTPLQTMEAVVVGQRLEVRGGDSRPETASHLYYVTFEVQGHARQEFGIYNGDHLWITPGDRGLLRYQGTRYQGFNRTSQA